MSPVFSALLIVAYAAALVVSVGLAFEFVFWIADGGIFDLIFFISDSIFAFIERKRRGKPRR